jgi:integrase
MNKVKVQHYGDGRWGFDEYSGGKRKMVRCKTKEKALSRAMDVNVLMANGRVDLLQGTPAEWEEFKKWKSACRNSSTLGDACREFVALKKAKSTAYYRALKNDLTLFEQFIGSTQLIGEIKALDIQRFIHSRNVGLRRQLNLRMSVIGLFLWAKRMSYVDPDRMTEAEKVEPIEKVPGQPNVLTPEQMRTLLENVREEYLPWLCVAAFAGVRSEEIAPEHDSKKSRLKWEDFDWENQVIIVRAQTAKTREEREVPISQNLAQWLEPYRHAKGPICALRPSNYETARLGAFIGGWKHNALRDSFCSYRARITQNVPQVSYEMGNSVSMVKRSYHRRQPIKTAQQWFDIRPNSGENIVQMAAQR